MNDRFARMLGLAGPGVVVFCAVAVGLFFDLAAATLVLAGAALLGAILTLWASLQALFGNAPMTTDEAIALAHLGAVDERKRAILQALKDLQFDNSVGKIAQSDYDALVSSYRREAKGLLRAMDADVASRRDNAVAYVNKHRRRAAAREKTRASR